ncbi:hypothetical protein [Spirosoma panaciterrae]|uniref:hypothetical protein n=1 Tax=Spirosoma panaciterrae TaxID=496058 RepID=UPI00037C4D67|nr:hypothetical protein [Spirosoma panaciterrae]
MVTYGKINIALAADFLAWQYRPQKSSAGSRKRSPLVYTLKAESTVKGKIKKVETQMLPAYGCTKLRIVAFPMGK